MSKRKGVKMMKKRTVRGVLLILFCIAAMAMSSMTVHAALYRKTTAAVNLRSKANSTDKATIITTVPKGATVELVGRSSNYPDWYYINYNGKKGFVPSSYLTTTDSSSSSSSSSDDDDDDDDDSSGTTRTLAVNLNFRSSAKIDPDNIIRVLAKGTEVTVLGETSSNWVYVQAPDGKKGYVATGYFTSESSSSNKVYQTTACALNMRKTREIKSGNVILVIPANKKVQVLSEIDGWFKVKYNSKTGYVKSGYFKSNTSTSTVTETVAVNLRLRSTAKITSSNIILTIPKGSKVKVIKEASGYWFYVQYGSHKGYVKGGYFKSDGSSSDSESSSGTTKNATANVRLRSSRSTSSSSNIITVIPKGASVKVHSEINGWYKVTYSGQTGYASADYIS